MSREALSSMGEGAVARQAKASSQNGMAQEAKN